MLNDRQGWAFALRNLYRTGTSARTANVMVFSQPVSTISGPRSTEQRSLFTTLTKER